MFELVVRLPSSIGVITCQKVPIRAPNSKHNTILVQEWEQCKIYCLVDFFSNHWHLLEIKCQMTSAGSSISVLGHDLAAIRCSIVVLGSRKRLITPAPDIYIRTPKNGCIGVWSTNIVRDWRVSFNHSLPSISRRESRIDKQKHLLHTSIPLNLNINLNMKGFSVLTAGLLTLSTQVSGHCKLIVETLVAWRYTKWLADIFQQLTANNVKNPAYTYIRKNTNNNSPVTGIYDQITS